MSALVYIIGNTFPNIAMPFDVNGTVNLLPKFDLIQIIYLSNHRIILATKIIHSLIIHNRNSIKIGKFISYLNLSKKCKVYARQTTNKEGRQEKDITCNVLQLDTD